MWRSIPWRVLAILGLLIALLPVAAAAQPAGPPVLARVSLAGPVARVDMPVYAHLQDATGAGYLLVIAPRSRLDRIGWPYRVLATDARADDYLIALERRPGGRAAARRHVAVLYDDGRQLVARATPAQAETLAGLGFDLQRLPARPIIWTAPLLPAAAPVAITADPQVAAMIGQVQQSTVYTYTGGLSGEWPVTVGGSPYTIKTRYTGSGTPIQKATQYAYEHLQGLGLAVGYHDWSGAGRTGRNVIGAKAGIVRPEEIVLITAHLDDTSNINPATNAPGADDNASGSTGVLVAADIFSRFQFERTVRFALFTGEEQGLLGSMAYADDVWAAGENVVAVYNMDMIAWDKKNGPTLRLHTRTTWDPGYPADLAIANLFGDVLNAYSLSASLTPIITADSENASDHASFWNKGYPAILAIEDDYNDFNTFSHTVNDTLSRLNLTYFTNYVKASVGTVAHLAGPFLPITIQRSDAGAVLTWSHCCDNFTRYEVYRATAPYVAPAAAGSVKLANVTPPAVWSTAIYTDTHAFDPPPTDYFYRVVAVAAGEQPYTRSTETGTFNFILVSGEP
jgi:hypothetical protein